ncbi:MAG: hypothetical protein V7641_1836 [Blastocatellia bacterium]
MTTSMNQTNETAQAFPLRAGRAEDFARVESLLKSSGFDEASLCRLLDIREMADLSSVKPDEVDLAAAGRPLLAVQPLRG